MSIIITDLPDEINPIILIEKKVKKCPLCGQQCDEKPANWNNNKEFIKPYLCSNARKADKNGKVHKILKFKNKYWWKKYTGLRCPSCKCEWNTEWFPIDPKMFEITLKRREKLDD